jgi:maleate cis-trans isomerase
MNGGTARYTWGMIGPGAGVEDPEGGRWQRLLPEDVRQVNVGLAISDYTVDGVDEAIVRYNACYDKLIAKGAERVVLGGVPICSQLGRARVMQLSNDAANRTGVPADSTNEAIIGAFTRLGVRTVAIASRWARQLNDAMVGYFDEAGITTAAVTSVGQWAAQGSAMSIEEGILMAVHLGREAKRLAGNPGAILLPGGAWRSLTAVPILEEEFGIPVVTNNTARAWRLVEAGIAPPLQGWGMLMASPPRPD